MQLNIKTPLCEYLHVHHETVEKVNKKMPSETVLYDLSEFYKIFGDSTRIKILYVLFESEMCVCDIANIIKMSQSAISHQLRVLKTMKIVRFRRAGKIVFYSLVDDHIRSIIDQGLQHIAE